jgi:hypothetical protein
VFKKRRKQERRKGKQERRKGKRKRGRKERRKTCLTKGQIFARIFLNLTLMFLHGYPGGFRLSQTFILNISH